MSLINIVFIQILVKLKRGHEQRIYQTNNMKFLQTGNNFKCIINDKNANKTTMRFLLYNYLELSFNDTIQCWQEGLAMIIFIPVGGNLD